METTLLVWFVNLHVSFVERELGMLNNKIINVSLVFNICLIFPLLSCIP